jgi:hypothetical protein
VRNSEYFPKSCLLISVTEHQTTLTSLTSEQSKSKELDSRLNQLESERQNEMKRIRELEAKEKDLTDKHREQVRINKTGFN